MLPFWWMDSSASLSLKFIHKIHSLLRLPLRELKVEKSIDWAISIPSYKICFRRRKKKKKRCGGKGQPGMPRMRKMRIKVPLPKMTKRSTFNFDYDSDQHSHYIIEMANKRPEVKKGLINKKENLIEWEEDIKLSILKTNKSIQINNLPPSDWRQAAD